ncbi:hypothetical protein LYSHEL_03370 [Lysobacter helvus]|uniref:DUF4189 domain-containing protein n=2 Tax=Lysobacteraceae TaxID=32033 RepID=A0ABM7Q231_9GAMM|nr:MULTISPECIES: hypothetical protein [Lysobacter]BCT91313.1 hypothetical protein LYSCAS_03370 [Lysobacter caseinilyticus]BCT94466.1 hypothetical protein LYSHEL_03370 [Lysobacter helvus]
MRITLIALAFALALAPAVHAQEATKTFTATGSSEAQACDAANKQARDWVKRGKSEGRTRTLVEAGQCTCTAQGATQSCKLDARVTDAQYEAEEEG